MIYYYEDEMKRQNTSSVRDQETWKKGMEKLYEKFGLKDSRQRPRDPEEARILKILEEREIERKKGKRN